MPWFKRSLQLSVLLLFMGYVINLWEIPFIDSFERELDDVRTNFYLTEQIDPRIVIVDIDEASLIQFGQWPWSRFTIAKLINELGNTYQVNTIGFDIVFSEPTIRSEEFIQSLIDEHFISLQKPLAELVKFAPEDIALADSMNKQAIVAGFIFKTDNTSSINQLPESLETLDNVIANDIDLPKPKGVSNNIPIIQQAATNYGFFDNPIVDPDGVYRHASLLQVFENKLFPSLALAVTQLAISPRDEKGKIESLSPIYIEKSHDGNQLSIDLVQLGRYIIRTGKTGSARVPFHSSTRGFNYISAADVLNGSAVKTTLQNKIVFIGTTAPGLNDIRTTATNSQLPGVEVHANIVAGILDNNIPYQPTSRIAVELAQLLLVSLVLWCSFYFSSPLIRMVVTVAVTSSIIMFNLYWWQQHLILPLAATFTMIGLMYLIDTSWELLIENRNKRVITRIFGQYVPPELVTQIANKPSDLLLKGEERNLSVLFSDVRGFTSISETLTPEQLSKLMNQLLTPLTKVIHQYHGTIDKYMGDAVMAFWGAPIAMEDHANQSVAAALAMQVELQNIQSQLSEFGVSELGMSIGINTGLMSVGNMGSEFRLAYTVMGDAVNLGSRLEALTRQYGIDILVSETTQHSATDYAFKEIDRVRVKGKLEPVTIFEPIALVDLIDDKLASHISSMTNALALYRQQKWSEAKIEFENLNNTDNRNTTLYQLYLARIETLCKQELPDDWDGVIIYTTKS